jgi:YVTN family beta-propeller protein
MRQLYATFWVACALLVSATAGAQSLVTTIPVEETAERMAITPDGARLYTVGRLANNISVIDTSLNTVLTVILRAGPSPVGDFPDDIVVSPDGVWAYVSSGGRDIVSVIDTTTNAVVADIPVGDNPSSLVVSPDGSRLYVTTAGPPGGVDVIDTTTLAVLTTVPVLPDALARTMTVHPGGSRLYVASAPGGVTVIDTATSSVVANIPTNGWRLTLNADGSRLYVHSQFGDRIDVVDTTSNAIVASVPMGASGPDPEVIAMTPDGTRVYATNFMASSVSVLDTATNALVGTIPFGAPPFPPPLPPQPVGLGVSPDSSVVFVATTSSLAWLDVASSTVTTSLPVGADTVSGETPVVSPDGSTLYTACGSFVCVFETGVSTVQAVSVDIKPGSIPNSINPRSQGLIPVAILAAAGFDPAMVDVSTVRFGGSGSQATALHSALEDVNGDGDLDLVLHFSTRDSGSQCGDSRASITGRTVSGRAFEGSDAIRAAGCK